MWYPDIRLTRTFRLTFMVTLIVTFFIVSPLIILYTAGYRFDIQTGQILKTGVITIDATPISARAYLNDVLLQKTIPIRLTNRAPGSYTVRIEEPGYLPWSQTIEVKSVQTTYITDVRLYRNSLPTFEYPLYADTQIVAPSWDGSSIGSVRQVGTDLYEAYIYTIETGTEALVWRGPSTELPTLTWSYAAPLLAVSSIQNNTTRTILTVNARDIEEMYTYALAASPSTTLQWDVRGRNVLYTDDARAVVALSGNTRIPLQQVTSSVWFVDGDEHVWTISQGQEIQKDAESVIHTHQDSGLLSIISVSPTHLIGRTAQDTRIVWFDSGDMSVLPTTHILPNTSHKSQSWITWSPWEVWQIEENGTSALITRTTEALRDVQISEAHGSLILLFEHSVAAYHPGYRTTHLLFQSADTLETLSVDSGSTYLLFETAINGKRGIYKREL